MDEPTLPFLGAQLTPDEFGELYNWLHRAWDRAPYGSDLEQDAEDALWEMESGAGWNS